MKKNVENLISTFTDEAYELKSKANKALQEVKKYEATQKLHVKKIGKNTIVCCKNESRFAEYEKLYKFKDVLI